MQNVFPRPYQLDESISNWTSPFPILGLLDGIQFYSNFKRNYCKQTVENLIRRRILHCLPMSNKKDARLIWVNGVPITNLFCHCLRNRGSYMSTHVLLNLLNELGENDKILGLSSI